MTKPNVQALIDSGDATTAVIELDNYISQLCEYGEQLGKLTAPQKVFYLNQNLEREGNNGGFHQFFFNSSGDHADETVRALEAIGASKTAGLLREAIEKFPNGEVQEDQDKRQVLMIDTMPNDIFGELDERFFAYEDPLTDLNFNWIRDNAEEF